MHIHPFRKKGAVLPFLNGFWLANWLEVSRIAKDNFISIGTELEGFSLYLKHVRLSSQESQVQAAVTGSPSSPSSLR